MSMLPVALALLLGGLSGGGQESQNVTYRTVAKPLRLVCQELSAKLGRTIAPSQELAEEPLIVQVDKASAADLRERIAQAMHAEWTREGEIFRLVRTPAKRRALEKMELDEQTAAIQTMLERERASLQQQPFGELEAEKYADAVAAFLKVDPESTHQPMFDWRKTRDLNNQGPMMRLMKRLITSFDAKTLALLPREEKHCFASPPKALQLPLPAGASSAIRAFERELALWKDAARKRNLSQLMEKRGTWESNTLALLEAAEEGRPSPSRYLLTFSRLWFTNGGTLELFGADESGKIAFRSYFTLYEDELLKSIGSPPPQPEKGEALKFSPLTEEYLRLLARRYGEPGSDAKPMTKELREVLLNPERRDPLSLLPSEAVMARAKQDGKSLVACLSDMAGVRMVDNVRSFSVSSLTAWDFLLRWGDTEALANGGWLVLRPRAPASALRLRDDRKALGAFLRESEKAGRVTVDAEARFVATRPVDGLTVRSLTNGHIDLLFPDLFRISGQNRQEALWLHGSLTMAQRAALKQGPLRFVQLSGDQKRAFLKALKSAEEGLIKADAPTANQGDVSRWPAFAYGDIRKNATEALPYGVPVDAPIRLANTADLAFRGMLVPQGETPREATMRGLSAAESIRNFLRWPEDVERDRRYEWVEPLNADTILYQLFPAEGVRLDLRLTELSSAGPRVKSFKDLPADFMKRVDELLKQSGSGSPPPTGNPIRR